MRARSLFLAGILGIAPLANGCAADDADPCPAINDAAKDFKTFQDDRTLFPTQAEAALEQMKFHLEEAVGPSGDSGNLHDGILEAIQAIDNFLPLYHANQNASYLPVTEKFGNIQSFCAESNNSIVAPD